MKVYTVQVFGQVLRGTWKQHATFGYKAAAAAVTKIIKQDPSLRVTVWDRSYEIVVNTRVGVETRDDCYSLEHRYIASAMRNARL